MPSFPWPGRRDASDDAPLAALLAGMPTDLPAELQPAADVLAALRARPTADELAGESMALAEYRGRVGRSAPARHRHRRRAALVGSLLSARAAVAAACVAVAIGGVATAAYAGALPSRAQGIAHDWIGAPAVHKGTNTAAATHHSAAGNPAASHHPVLAQCAAYSWAKAHGTAAQKAAAYGKLAKAVGGADKIATSCPAAEPNRMQSFRRGCQPVPATSWLHGPQPASSQRPQPSSSGRPRPSWSDRAQQGTDPCALVPLRHLAASPPPDIKYFPQLYGKHLQRHVHVGKPGRPVGKPTPPSGLPTPTPRLRHGLTAPRR